MRILVVTNRNLEHPNANDETLFGNRVNANGPCELRLAWAEQQKNDVWQVTLKDEPQSQNLNFENLPSREMFKEFRTGLIEVEKNAVFYIHGYNKSFGESLDQAHLIQEKYDVGVVVFSWPADPGGFIPSISEYRQAKAIADSSSVAIDRVFEGMSRYFREVYREPCPISFNLLVHSLGNHLFEKFILNPIFSDETRLFDNIILNAPDVHLDSHTAWVGKLRYARRVYITINERDAVLAISDAFNPDRLGNTTRNLNSMRVKYIDLTNGQGVLKKHLHFRDSAQVNQTICAFFKSAFNGLQAENEVPQAEIRFNQQTNAYEIL